MKYEDLVYQQKLFVENMNNKLDDLRDVNNRLKHSIIMGNERLKASKTVHKEKESYTSNDEIEVKFSQISIGNWRSLLSVLRK